MTLNQNLLKLQKLLLRLKISDFLLSPNDPLLSWLQAPFDDSFVIVRSKGYPLIITSPLSGSVSSSWMVFKCGKPLKLLKELLDVKRVAVNDVFLPTSVYKFLLRIGKKPVNISNHLAGVRRVKNPDEISLLKEVASLTDNLFQEIINNFSSFKREKDVVRFIKEFAIKNDCELSFNPIVASGVNAAVPHYDKHDSLINEGFLIVDAGLRKNNYCSDMTRTFFVGIPSANDRKIYNKVLSLQKSAVKNSVPGASVSVLDSSVRSVLGKNFVHSLGHGVGVEVHEAPRISFKSGDVLLKNEVVAIEPGYYDSDKGIGIRIEDMVLVRERPLRLTRFPVKLIVLEH